MTSFIVGSGISGMVAKKFFRHFKLVSDKSKSVLPAPFYLWSSEYVDKFVSDFDVSAKAATVTCNYIGDNIKLYNEVTHKNKSSAPSRGKKSFRAYRIKDFEERVDEIVKIKKIDTVRKKMDSRDFDKIIWTAPANMIEVDGKCNKSTFTPVYFYQFSAEQNIFNADYVYLLKNEFLKKGIYRLSYYKNCVTVESVSKLTTEDIQQFMTDIKEYSDGTRMDYIGYYKRTYGHIKDKEETQDTEELKFLGRFAQVDSEVMVSDVIEKCYKIKEANL